MRPIAAAVVEEINEDYFSLWVTSDFMYLWLAGFLFTLEILMEKGDF